MTGASCDMCIVCMKPLYPIRVLPVRAACCLLRPVGQPSSTGIKSSMLPSLYAIMNAPNIQQTVKRPSWSRLSVLEDCTEHAQRSGSSK